MAQVFPAPEQGRFRGNHLSAVVALALLAVACLAAAQSSRADPTLTLAAAEPPTCRM